MTIYTTTPEENNNEENIEKNGGLTIDTCLHLIDRSKFKRVLLVVRELFMEKFTTFYLNDRFDSALLYQKLVDEFLALLNSDDLNSSKTLLEVVRIYKVLYVKSYQFEHSKNFKKYKGGFLSA